ncbi:ABC transporter ATP-binding protein [Sutcliffiella rhizosphaerae]|uniref:ABC transporter ATP-binding protein YxlF n=1 Tax=Sutcliffiella rhizosphaerae TaxID=2880967 RepID=A0ABM8YNJ8_9BACI|nr:ABC transporter ATP-binding protein [Sutcliffiella rhizosphaerae]CAG9621377.1 putative ABC transporter ATP-binding protein YxlF [Sutcliffiella rhizosphaerae]
MLVEIKHLKKSYKQHQAVNGISFQIEKGSCVALLGPNGAGKTTTLQMLAGMLTPTSGTIQFGENTNRDFRQQIGFLPQHPSFFNWMTPVEFLQFVGKLSHIPQSKLSSKIEETLEFVSLQDVKAKRIGGFSGGMKQRLGLAQALLHKPELLILDEPVSALDPDGRRDVIEIIQQLKSTMTILFSTHVLHDAEQVCDSVIMLKQGEIAWNGSLEELRGKHTTSSYKIQTDQSLTGKLDGVIGIDSIEYLSSHTAKLHVNEAFQTNVLLHKLIEHNLTLCHFEQIQDSLEDAYMKVMNQ